MRIGAIEAGGTKFVCGIGNEMGIIEDRISVPPGLGDNAGLCGALARGLKALKTSNE